ncbi:uncharacterized protein LAESUDRAFT_762128 [Laetiporus sulphureus 93-53]|uniref:Uncharacterized protein n=1 Tax=Laetiporus sulphureus 93-53 TaxID=1314785 RepID=A0A165CNJ8_9APHY|nr:uncharacterized protein LAESUDRAFT_762128 [Laetiporus sulphureus 93-53]KZT03135.1 hypothetical protein LAESUDRAFT_762128 [Laetiporus sulphureus 93-53]
MSEITGVIPFIYGGETYNTWYKVTGDLKSGHLIIGNASASMELWMKGTNALLERLPEDLRETLRRHEREGTTDSKECQDGMQVFYQKHVLR